MLIIDVQLLRRFLSSLRRLFRANAPVLMHQRQLTNEIKAHIMALLPFVRDNVLVARRSSTSPLDVAVS